MRTLLVVAAALMNEAGEVLLAQRPKGKTLEDHWEFPGGKLEEGEGPEQALARELMEELGIEVAISDMQPLTFLSHPYPEYEFHLMMPTWLVKKWQGTPAALEHQAVKWVHPNDMKGMLILEADWPLVERLKEITKNPA